MTSLCRLLLVCLMALALPLQGLAAAGVLPCASGHLPGTHAGTPHAEAHADCHGAPAPMALPARAADTAQQAPASDAPVAVHKCSACAACGAGMAFSASTPVLPMAGPQPAPALPVDAAAASFIASGLERPPRAHLA